MANKVVKCARQVFRGPTSCCLIVPNAPKIISPWDEEKEQGGSPTPKVFNRLPGIVAPHARKIAELEQLKPQIIRASSRGLDSVIK